MSFNLKCFISIVIISFLFGSCQQQNTTTPPPCSYSAYTTGSEFLYSVTSSTAVDTIREYVVGDSIVDGYSCQVIQRTTTADSSITTYLAYCGNGNYMHKNLLIPGYGVTVDSLVYLKDNLSAGDSWTNTFSGTFGGFSVVVDYENHYIATEATRVVNGETFNNVIQIRVDLYSTVFNVRQSTGSFNYYFAEGVGLIENDVNQTKLIDYTIVP
ncbi:hypothetical protein [Aureispira anguillae]|uniref:Lipoprotein n=1 Tax=Aureispira anguillae TaxID=2864201 RepID=A0A915YFU9_9BACT|nr:hypothetical protein [Aureispira anguillae]BDS12255.1 hypothetical protein AsAng_0029740 [Aureispira anguillae]